MEIARKSIIKEVMPSDLCIIEKTKWLYDECSKRKLFYNYIYGNTYDIDTLKASIAKGIRIFASLDPNSNELLAFVHYSIKDNIVVLENITSSFIYSNQSLLKSLLVCSLREIFSEKSFHFLELTVFENDKRTLNLFLSIGMNIASYNYWYDITSYCSKDLTNKGPKEYAFNKASFYVQLDYKDQLTLYYKKHFIGIIVKNQYLIIKSDFDYVLFEKINFFFKGSALKSVYLVSKKELELFLIDKSFYLTLSTKEIRSLKV